MFSHIELCSINTKEGFFVGALVVKGIYKLPFSILVLEIIVLLLMTPWYNTIKHDTVLFFVVAFITRFLAFFWKKNYQTVVYYFLIALIALVAYLCSANHFFSVVTFALALSASVFGVAQCMVKKA